jgi:DNA polymerase
MGWQYSMRKAELLNKLYSEYEKEFGESDVVLGGGNINAKILLIGEAPGKDEVKQGKPFVGTAGKNLDEFLKIIGLNREEVYITNAIKFRLSRVNAKTGRLSNRPSGKNEIEDNRPYLVKEINIIKPDYIVTLGNVPLKAVTDDYSVSIGNYHGAIKKITVGDESYKLFPLYHPASIIYKRELKETYIQDILKFNEIIKYSKNSS